MLELKKSSGKQIERLMVEATNTSGFGSTGLHGADSSV
ncbi:hypothetical protein OROHE_002008 [Orobanche hederae]